MSAHELDHVAFAVPSWRSAGDSVHRTLGARWVSGFHQGSFSPCQLELAEGMRLELLAPPAQGGGFIAEHLERSNGGANPHHITFKVADIHASMTLARAAGVRTILENLDNQWWKELFLHPKDTGLGFLVQLVQTELTLDGNDEITAPGAVAWPLGSSLVLQTDEHAEPALQALSFTDPSLPAPIMDGGYLKALRGSGRRFEALGLDILTGHPAHAG